MRRLRDRVPRGASTMMCVAADEAKIKQLRTILEEVRQLREGAFAPITSQPIVRAALLPLSGAGGIALLEYFFLRR